MFRYVAVSCLWAILVATSPANVDADSSAKGMRQPARECPATDYVKAGDRFLSGYRRGVFTADQKIINLHEAIMAYEKALDCEPFDLETRLLAADLSLERDDFKSFQAHFTVLNAFYPLHPRSIAMFGRMLRKMGDSANAVAVQRKAVEFDPGQPYCLGALAFTLYMQDETSAEAEGLYREVLRLTDGATTEAGLDERYCALVVLGKLYAARKEDERGIALLEEACALEPKRFEAYSVLAKTYHARGQGELAMKAIDQALELHQGAEYLLGLKKIMAGEKEELKISGALR